ERGGRSATPLARSPSAPAVFTALSCLHPEAVQRGFVCFLGFLTWGIHHHVREDVVEKSDGRRVHHQYPSCDQEGNGPHQDQGQATKEETHSAQADRDP